MAVSIDTVYQRVLAIANKEQRGYITPQEFNLFANQAQIEIFEQYFYDVNQWNRQHGNKIGTVSHIKLEVNDVPSRVTFQEVNYDEYQLLGSSPLTRPTLKRPYFINQNGALKLFTGDTLASNEVGLSFIRKPVAPNWAYVVVHGKTLYNDHISVDFELHASEESELVYRILAYAGISIGKPEITQVASQALASQIQQEKQ